MDSVYFVSKTALLRDLNCGIGGKQRFYEYEKQDRAFTC